MNCVQIEPQFSPVTDHALLVTLGDTIDDEIHHSIVALDKAITRAKPEGLIEVVPAIVNLLIIFDSAVTDHIQIESEIHNLWNKLDRSPVTASVRTVLVCYDEPFSPDLAAVAKACNLDEESIISAHMSGAYKVLMYGFAPGYAYLGGVPEDIQVPRKPSAVRDIPAGSVLIAGPQCLVTTLKMPAGWSVIGYSPTRILLDQPERQFLFDVGDEVRFERIDRQTCEELRGRKNDE